MPPLPVTVTTRMIPFLVEDTNKPSCVSVPGRGSIPIYIHDVFTLHTHILVFHRFAHLSCAGVAKDAIRLIRTQKSLVVLVGSASHIT